MQKETKISNLVLLTGGGSAGHVVPNLALVPALEQKGLRVKYIGSVGVEEALVKAAGVEYFKISAGKLRRYLSWQNITDIFKVLFGTFQSAIILWKEKPCVVFSKGGFVSVPVAVAAWCLRIPVVSHESDLTPGLANKIIAKFSHKVLYSFPETGKYLPSSSEHVGTPIRQEVFSGRKEAGRMFTGLETTTDKVLLVVGGSLGALRINNCLFKCLPELVTKYQVIHITGPNKTITFEHPRYRSYEFLGKEFFDVIALADVVVSRAGANSIFEFLALNKPMLLIPLELGSRGDQVQNAQSFEKQGWALVCSEKGLDKDILLASIEELVLRSDEIFRAQQSFKDKNVIEKVVFTIARYCEPETP